MRFKLAEVEPELKAVTPGYRELIVRVRPRQGPATVGTPGKSSR
jgi:hypothetical protein